ncbi:GTP-binding protein Obg/CgtA [Penicillium nucicola]|uniref:GTP-binding protein Obg/CgtA n=1 Tax=Penicillium nucicola TaxID=1850975 RepID=UPI002545BC20|nr:GTP-binding protein Obg/CgtA [Penicillium nucicola]KAJ5747145.1 GTP-binding protein Obg/CgtA [Penicillium nucicola]
MAHSRAYFSLPVRPFLSRQARCSRIFLQSPKNAFTAQYRLQSTNTDTAESSPTIDVVPDEPSSDLSHLNPPPEDYSRFIFQDKCRVTMHAGSGGHGCVAYLREKYIEEGPPNGGDGGSGGGIYIQTVEGLTSLHKLARRGVLRASRGRNGQGKSKGGKRGDDILIQVPVGTVVREISRHDPVEDAWARIREEEEAEHIAQEEQKMFGNPDELEDPEGPEYGLRETEDPEFNSIRHDRWVLHPSAKPSDFLMVEFPKSYPRRQNIAAMEPKAPIWLDLSKPMDKPLLLAAGGAGGYGNPHFSTRTMGRPKFASRGEGGMTLELDFELKLLADVGLVGKPNAGKSTLLRSLTNSRTRIGNWEFTTLSPHIGTVITDDMKGRPLVASKERRTHFTIADIPGLVEDAHLDRGLGLGFLRHIDRAGILAFVVDLSHGDPVEELKKLWHELGEYERVRDMDPDSAGDNSVIDWNPFGNDGPEPQKNPFREPGSQPLNTNPDGTLPRLMMTPLHLKPWFVVATKADLENTQDQYRALQEYLSAVQDGSVEHPSGHEKAWKEKLCAVPVSARRGEGVSRIPKLVMELLE